MATSGIILSTVRHIADADCRLLRISDGCADPNVEVHRVLIEKGLARQATVLSSGNLLDALRWLFTSAFPRVLRQAIVWDSCGLKRSRNKPMPSSTMGGSACDSHLRTRIEEQSPCHPRTNIPQGRRLAL
jgi:hypothetical protein